MGGNGLWTEKMDALQKDLGYIRIIHMACGDSPAGFTAGRERIIHEETRMILGSAQFYCNWCWTRTFRVWPRSFYFSHILAQHIFEKSIQITINSVPSAQQFETCLHWDSLQSTSGFFHKNGYCWLRDSAQDLGSRGLGWGKQHLRVSGLAWP